MDTNKKSKENPIILGLLTGFIVIPLILALYAHHFSSTPETKNISDFDTTMIPGFSFFKNHGISISEDSNPKLYNAIFPMVGTPHRSRTRNGGIDCSAFVKSVYRQTYETEIKGSSRDIHRNSKEIARDNLKEGDLLFFNIGSSQVNHVGIYLNNNKFIHVSEEKGVTIDDLSDKYYAEHFFQAGRINP
jgi:hypothetical protein